MCVPFSKPWLHRHRFLQVALALAGHFLCILTVVLCIGFFQAELFLQRQPEFLDDSLPTFAAWLHTAPSPPSNWYASEEAAVEIYGFQCLTMTYE